MKRVALCAIALIAAATLAGPILASPTTETMRSGATYYVGRVGSSWSYAADKGKARVSIETMENWASRFHVEWGKRSTSGTWRVKDGAWMQKMSAHEESIVLPAQVAVGARWSAPTSIERGGEGTSKYEVISLDAEVELANGDMKENCAAVLETGADGERPVTHFYAPNGGKVAVQGTDGWLLRLLEFRMGGRSSGGGE